MAFYSAKEIIKDGKGSGLYHWTCSDGGGTYALGYCSPWETCPECKGKSSKYHLPSSERLESCSTCNRDGIVRKENPCPGHPTEKEAHEHYRQYVIDNMKFDSVMKVTSWSDCAACGGPAKNLADGGHMEYFVLCDKHYNKEGVIRAYKFQDEKRRPVADGESEEQDNVSQEEGRERDQS